MSLAYCVDEQGTRFLPDDGDFVFRDGRFLLEEATSTRDWFVISNILGVILCLAFVALVSGLFMGLLTMEVLDLHIILRVADNEDDVARASSLLPIVRQHHRVLVTLLLLNGIAYEALPLFIDNLVPTGWTIFLSVTFVLFFGEIVPCAVFIGPNQLELASRLTPIMRFFLVITYPLAYPLAKLLDYIVGTEAHDETTDHYNRNELSALIRIQYEERMATKKSRKLSLMAGHIKSQDLKVKEDQRTWRALKKEIMEAVEDRITDESEEQMDTTERLNPPLLADEINMVEGALSMKTKVAMDVYTPMRMMYAIPHDMILDKENIMDIFAKGYSRIPVYDPRPSRPRDHTAIRGILMTRLLIVIDWDHERSASTLPLQQPPCVSPRMNLVALISLFQTCGSHMALVCARPDVANRALDNGRPLPVEAGFMGLVTLEDVLEELIQDRIYDEIDVKERHREATRLTQWAASKLQEWYKKKQRKIKGKNSGTVSPRVMTTPNDEEQGLMPTVMTPLLGNRQEDGNPPSANGGSC
jgi:metal transporter CNNM